MDRIVVSPVISNLEYGGAQRQAIELANHVNRERFDMISSTTRQ